MALVLQSRRFTRMEVPRALQGTASVPATPCAPRRRHVSTAQASHDPVVASMTIIKGKTVATLTAANMNDFLQQHREQLVVVDYHTPLCGPCKFMGPVIEEMAQEFEDVVFAKFDCGTDSDSKQLALKAGIRALPTFQLYRHSPEGATQVLAELTGTKTKQLRHLVMHHRNSVSAQ